VGEILEDIKIVKPKLFTIHLYKENKSYCVDNILTDVLPDDLNTFCSYYPKVRAWQEFLGFLNHSSVMITKIKVRESQLLKQKVVT